MSLITDSPAGISVVIGASVTFVVSMYFWVYYSTFAVIKRNIKSGDFTIRELNSQIRTSVKNGYLDASEASQLIQIGDT